jgi:hypothetical protein
MGEGVDVEELLRQEKQTALAKIGKKTTRWPRRRGGRDGDRITGAEEGFPLVKKAAAGNDSRVKNLASAFICVFAKTFFVLRKKKKLTFCSAVNSSAPSPLLSPISFPHFPRVRHHQGARRKQRGAALAGTSRGAFGKATKPLEPWTRTRRRS